MHGWLCHFSYVLKFVFSRDCYLVRSEFMWVLSICLLCNHWWWYMGPSEIWMKPNMSLSFSNWKERTNWGFSFAPYAHNFCWFFKFWGRLLDLGTWWRSCYVCEPSRRETKSLYCQGKQSLCIAKGNKVFVLPKKCTLLQSANFPTTLLWLGNLEWAQICMLCVCLFIKLCWNDKPGTTLNSTAMSSQLTFCVALCHKIMP